MNNPLTTHHFPPATANERLAAELTGLPPHDLLKIRATDDSLVVIIHTGQKFIYDLSTIQAALERLAAGLGRFTDDYFRSLPEPEPLPSPDAAQLIPTVLPTVAPAPKPKARLSKSKPK